MKRFLIAVTLAAATAPLLAADVGVSVTVGQPGFYGRIDIGDFPQPQLIYPEPIIVQRLPAGVVRQPIHLHVPPGHAKHWRKHCRKYNACGQPVYFVRDNWYNDVYVPRYHERGAGRDEHRGKKHDKDRGHGHGKGHKGD